MTQPPFAITATILNQVAAISESLGRLSVQQAAYDGDASNDGVILYTCAPRQSERRMTVDRYFKVC